MMIRVIFGTLVVLGLLFVGVAASATAQESFVPDGVESQDLVSGIYPSDTKGACCWLGDAGVVRVSPPADARALLINVVIPPYALRRQPQRLRVRIGSDRDQLSSPLTVGEHELVVKLPAHPKPPLLVRMNAAYTFVPAQLGMNQDPRHLSVLVRAFAFDTPHGTPVGDEPQLPRPVLFTLLAFLGVAIFSITLRSPVYGLCALIVTDPFLLGVYIHGTTLTLPKVAIAAVALGLIPPLCHSKELARNRALLILLGAQTAYIATMLLASIHAHNHGAAMRETLKAMEYAATLLVAYAAYRVDPNERAVRFAILALTFAVAVPALLQERAGAREAEIIAGYTVARIAGPLDGPNQLAGFLGIVMPVLVAFWCLRPRLPAEGLAILVGILACIVTFSRGGMVGLAAGLLVIGAVHAAKAPRKTFAIALGTYVVISMLAFLVFAGSAPHAVAAALGAGQSHDFNNGLGSRLDLWQSAYAMWRAHQLFGIGPGNYELAIGHYVAGLHTHANGMFFQTLAEQGVLGLLAFLAVTAASVGVFLRRLDNPFALGAIGASTALAFHQIVDCIVIYPKVGVIWWIILGVGAASVDALRSFDSGASHLRSG